MSCKMVPSVFQSTLSMRRASNTIRGASVCSIFQSTLSMRRALFARQSQYLRLISIHALHEESVPRLNIIPSFYLISIHALHEESGGQYTVKNLNDTFQSTLSMRRALTALFIISEMVRYISIHALHEESDAPCCLEP